MPLRPIAVVLIAACLATCASSPLKQVEPSELKSIAQVLSLTNEEAGRQYPFHLRSQVILYNPKSYWFFLQEGKAGIYASCPEPNSPHAADTSFALCPDSSKLHPGDWIEAEGVTARGSFAPILKLSGIRVVGSSPLPPPFKLVNSATPPEAANIWASAEGRIVHPIWEHGAGYGWLNFELALKAPHGEPRPNIQLLIASSAGCNTAALVDATVLVHGVLGTLSGGAGNSVGYAIYVSSCQEIQVTSPPHIDWAKPLVDIAHLMTYRSGIQIGDLVRVNGVVTLVQPSHHFFIQQGTSGILIEPIEDGAPPPIGETVEVLGRIVYGENGLRRLVAASFRPARAAQRFNLYQLKPQDLYRPNFAGAMVTAQGEVVAREVMPGRNVFGLRAGAITFTAELPVGNIDRDKLPEVGDQAEVTGIGLIRPAPEQRGYDVRLECSSAQSIHIVARRPIVERIAWGRISLVAIALACGALLWVFALRNRVLARTSQLEEANRRAELARDAAERASRSKSEFLANMSHEIRTPLNGVIGLADELASLPISPDAMELTRMIRSSGDALLKVISDILDFSKMEAGKLDLENAPFDLHRCLRESLILLRKGASEKGLRLSCELAPDLPVWVAGDGNRLRQVVLNLVSNAVKFTHAGQVTLTGRVDRTELTSHWITVEVHDTGIGIARAEIPKLFSSFHQTDASISRCYGGTGLGLAISKRIVDLMGGTIAVESEPGVGSTFRFTVPMSPALEPQAVAPSSQPGPIHRTLKVLVAEDNLINQRVLLKLLERLGIAADLAADGSQAIAAALIQSYDLILMDVQMPGVDGLSATREIRKQLAKEAQPVIFGVTAHATAEYREICLSVGMNGYMTKPVNPKELGKLIEELDATVLKARRTRVEASVLAHEES